MGIFLLFITCIISVTICYSGIQLTKYIDKKWIYAIVAIITVVEIILFILDIYNWIICDILILAISILLGKIVGDSIESKQALIAFSITISIIDVISFLFGPTKLLIDTIEQGSSTILYYLSIAIPYQGKIIPIFGIGDIFIIGIIYSAFKRIGYTGALPFFIPLLGLLLALVVGLLIGGIFALPFIGGATIIFLLLSKN